MLEFTNSRCSFCLQVVKTGGTPKVPDCFQRTPKKLCIPEKAEILAVNVDSKGQFIPFKNKNPCSLGAFLCVFLSVSDANSNPPFLCAVSSAGVHAVLKTGSWVRYCIFDLATGKAEQENHFPTSNQAFLGQSERNVAIFTAGQVSLAPSHSLCVLLSLRHAYLQACCIDAH